jgi:hypothetical protein
MSSCMKIEIDKERRRLAQIKFLKWVNREIRPPEMLTAYLDDKADDHNIGVYSALIPTIM